MVDLIKKFDPDLPITNEGYEALIWNTSFLKDKKPANKKTRYNQTIESIANNPNIPSSCYR